MFPFKVCCIQNKEEADLSILHGATTLGLVGPMPSGPGPIPLDQIKTIVNHVNHRVATWLLTSKTSYDEIIHEYALTQTSGIQLVDEVEDDVYGRLRSAYKDLFIVQVRHVETDGDPLELAAVAPEVDAILLDSGSPSNAVKVLGGTGKTHDWKISKAIIERAQVPVVLAGGLNPSNAQSAIAAVQPAALDVCSGLRTDGKLDLSKLKAWKSALGS